MNPLIKNDLIYVSKPKLIFSFINALPNMLAFIILQFYSLANTDSIFKYLSYFFLINMAFRIVETQSIHYSLTTQQIIFTKRLWLKKLSYISLVDIKDIVVSKSWIYKFLGIMDINLISSNPNQRNLELRGLPTSDLPKLIRENINMLNFILYQNDKIV